MTFFNMINIPIVLASQSPRRADILRQAGLQFRAISSPSDERFVAGMPPFQIAEYLANNKMQKSLHLKQNNEILLCADTIVVYEDTIYNKPKDEDDAIRMLSTLSDNTHTVYTGVSIAYKDHLVSFTEATQVTFCKLSEKVIRSYMNKFNLMDKAGAYGIQEGIGLYAVQRIVGCYFNVMGLPIHKVLHVIENL